MTPYEQGQHAEYIGKSIDDNPYTSRLDKQERSDWYQGWIDSREERDRDARAMWYAEAYF